MQLLTISSRRELPGIGHAAVGDCRRRTRLSRDRPSNKMSRHPPWAEGRGRCQRAEARGCFSAKPRQNGGPRPRLHRHAHECVDALVGEIARHELHHGGGEDDARAVEGAAVEHQSDRRAAMGARPWRSRRRRETPARRNSTLFSCAKRIWRRPSSDGRVHLGGAPSFGIGQSHEELGASSRAAR